VRCIGPGVVLRQQPGWEIRLNADGCTVTLSHHHGDIRFAGWMAGQLPAVAVAGVCGGGALCVKQGRNAVHAAVVPDGCSIANLRRRRGLVESSGFQHRKEEEWSGRRFCPTSQDILRYQVPQCSLSLRVSRWPNFLQRPFPISTRAIRLILPMLVIDE
jgi:hypothetical protein